MTNPRIGHYLNRDQSSPSDVCQAVNKPIEREGPNGQTARDLERLICRMVHITGISIAPNEFIEEMRSIPARERPELLRDAVIFLGGSWITPILGYGDHEYSVSLFGISATATSLDELCLNWLRCALRVHPETSMENAS